MFCLFSFLLALFQQGESRLRARQGGFAVAPLAPSPPMFLDFLCCMGNERHTN